eukprot:8999278-Pyramimonas_sp.AAC.1
MSVWLRNTTPMPWASASSKVSMARQSPNFLQRSRNDDAVDGGAVGSMHSGNGVRVPLIPQTSSLLRIEWRAREPDCLDVTGWCASWPQAS